MNDGVDHRSVRANGLDLHIAEAGSGPLIVLCHGFPELWYSWRHQLPALSRAGWHAVAPDQRGFGGSSRPDAIDAYSLDDLAADMVGLLDALGEQQAVFVGHDWGSPVVWHLALRHPARVRGVVGMSVPFRPRGEQRPTDVLDAVAEHMFMYIKYFQTPGVADAELARDPRLFIRRFLWTISGDSPRGAYKVLPHAGTGMLDVLSDPPRQLPAWLTEADIDVYANEFTRTGFTGGLNWYRNLDRNWDRSADLAGRRVEVPAGFIAGERDPVLLMAPPDAMAEYVPDLRVNVVLAGAGHWIQQERPDEVNDVLLEFLASL